MFVKKPTRAAAGRDVLLRGLRPRGKESLVPLYAARAWLS